MFHRSAFVLTFNIQPQSEWCAQRKYRCVEEHDSRNYRLVESRSGVLVSPNCLEYRRHTRVRIPLVIPAAICLTLLPFRRPMIGGFLSRPATRFPDLFGRSEFLKEYPYFLPCAVPATFSALAWIISWFYLEEVCSFVNSC